MKLYARLPVLTGLLVSLVFGSCKKESDLILPERGDKKLSMGHQPDDPGFTDNDMVMFWNEKTAIVLGAPGRQPERARLFAIIEIAVHDALNSIKPKFQRYALTGERKQFANPDAAVASAAYWAIKGLNRQGSFPVDEWYAASLAGIPDGESKELGKTLGKLSADAIISNRSNDGLAQVSITSVNPVGSSRVDLQACKLEYSIVSPK